MELPKLENGGEIQKGLKFLLLPPHPHFLPSPNLGSNTLEKNWGQLTLCFYSGQSRAEGGGQGGGPANVDEIKRQIREG